MDSYRAEKQAVMRIHLPDADAAVGPVPATDGGRLPEPELDRLSNILLTLNDQFGNIAWTDEDQVNKLIMGETPHGSRPMPPIRCWLTDTIIGLTYDG